MHTGQKLCHFDRYVEKVKLFCLKSFVPVTRAGAFIWENFHSDCQDLGCKNWDIGNQASSASHLNTLKFLRTKEWPGEVSENEPVGLTGLIRRGLNELWGKSLKIVWQQCFFFRGHQAKRTWKCDCGWFGCWNYSSRKRLDHYIFIENNVHLEQCNSSVTPLQIAHHNSG